jgi:hypothetical protein
VSAALVRGSWNVSQVRKALRVPRSCLYMLIKVFDLVQPQLLTGSAVHDEATQ